MRKINLAMIVGVTAVVLTACGGGNETATTAEETTAVETTAAEEETTIAETEEETEAIGTEEETALEAEESEESEVTTSGDSAPFKFETDDFSVEYLRHEVSEDYEGNPALVVYYTYTNNSDEASSAMVDAYIKAFQNGVERESAILMDSSDEALNYTKDVQPGYSLECRNAFVLEDMSDVTLEVTELVSFDDNKVTQVIKIQ